MTSKLTRFLTTFFPTRMRTVLVTLIGCGTPITTSCVTGPRATIGPLMIPAGGVADAFTTPNATVVAAAPPMSTARIATPAGELRSTQLVRSSLSSLPPLP